LNDDPAVYVVDDDAPARRAVTTLVEAMGLATFGFNSAEEFLAAYDGRRPACLVTDVRMLGMSGLELQEELIRRRIFISVVVLTGFATTPGTVRAMRNGAVTLLEKPCRDDELWEAIRNGLAADREALAREMSQDEIRRRSSSLTAREREVLSYISAGDANKIVARKMGVSLRTVELHRQSVFQKMGADSLAELVRMVVRLEAESDSPVD
jgi:FixJ family two-component response regulator